MNIKLFIDNYYSSDSVQAKRMENRLVQLLNWMKSQKLDFQDIKIEHLDFMFGSRTNISKTKFFETRRLLFNFFTWLSKQGIVGQEIVDKLACLSIKELIDRADLSAVIFKDELELDERIRRAAGGQKDAVLNIRSLALLYWYGIKVSSVVSLKKSDIDKKTLSIWVSKEKRRVSLDKHTIDILSLCALKDEVIGFPGGNRLVYMPSQYLFRSCFSTQSNLRNISNLLHHFNECVDPAQKLFLNPVLLRRNGLFLQVYKNPKEDISQITSIKNESDLKIFMLYYNKWKHYYNF